MSEGGSNNRQWPRALSEELYEFCRSDSLSENGLRAIIEGLAPNNGLNINYIFFTEACCNEKVTEGILRILLKYFPNAASATDAEYGNMPLHHLSSNRNVTPGMVQLLIDASPESLRHESTYGYTSFHYLCLNNNLGEDVRLEILKLLLEKCPESVQHANDGDGADPRDGADPPIHLAALYQSLEFCRILVDAYPGLVRMTDNLGRLPFHLACQSNNVAKVKYLYQLYPESINVADDSGCYPLHYAIKSIQYRNDNPETAVEMVQFLLDCDSKVALQQYQGVLPLCWVCVWATNENTPRLNAHLRALQILYDAHPEAIESNGVTSNGGRFCEEVQAFINTQIIYARQARDRALMTTPDENGQLPLHKALTDNAATLGSIKLLVKGNPSAVCTVDNRLRMPLHVACQHHETPAVVEYLIGLNNVTLRTTDEEGNTVLHYACIGANHAIIGLLLDKYGSMSVSKGNALSQLPIHLLLESNDVSGGDDIKYVESVYRLMRAHPETIMNSI